MSTSDKSYALWLRPFGNIAFSLEQRIQKLAKQYNTSVFEPHVTLLGGLRGHQEKMISLTKTLASSLTPFDIVLTRAGSSDEFFRALFVYVQDTPELMRARELAEELFETDDQPFNPHLSLLYGTLDRQTRERILNTMGREYHIRFRVKSLILVETGNQPEKWKKIHAAEFKNTLSQKK